MYEMEKRLSDAFVSPREGYRAFFDCLAEQRVPLLIFSGGVGDVLEELIRQNDVFHPNVHIISNYMDFDHTVSLTTTGDIIAPNWTECCIIRYMICGLLFLNLFSSV